MSMHKCSKVVMMLLLVVALSGCTTIFPKIDKLMNEPFTGPSWDVAVDVPLVHQYKVPVGKELAKVLEIDPENNEATLSYTGTIEGSEPVKLDLSSLSFQQVINLDEEVGDLLDSVIGNFENPATPHEFRYPFTAIDDITSSFNHQENFDFTTETQQYLDQIAETLTISKNIEVTAGQDYVDDLSTSLAFNETFQFDDNTADYIADIAQQLDVHNEYSIADKSGEVATDITNFLNFSDEASIPDDSAGTIDDIRQDFTANFFYEVNAPGALPQFTMNSKMVPIGTFESIQFQDDLGNPYFKYVVFKEGELQFSINNATTGDITDISVSLCNYDTDEVISNTAQAVLSAGQSTNLTLDLAGQTMGPRVYLIIALGTAGPAAGPIDFSMALNPVTPVSVKKVVVDQLQTQTTPISQPLPASASGISSIQFAAGTLQIVISESNPSGMTFDQLNVSLNNLRIGGFVPTPVGDNTGYTKTYSLAGLPIDFALPLNLEAEVVVESDTYNPGSTISIDVTVENSAIAEAIFIDPIAVNEEFTEQVSFTQIRSAQLSDGVLTIDLGYNNDPANLTIDSFEIWLGGQQLPHYNGSLTQFSLAGVDLLPDENGFLELRGVFAAASNKYIPNGIVSSDVSATNLSISTALLIDPVTIDSKADGQTISQPLTVEKVKEITFADGYIDITLQYAGGLTIDESQFAVQAGGQILPHTLTGQVISVELANQTLIFPDDTNVLDLTVDFVVTSDTYIAGAAVEVGVVPRNLTIANAILKEAIVVNETIEDTFELADIQEVEFADGVLNIAIDYPGGITIQNFDISIGGQVLQPLDDTYSKFSLAGVSLVIPEGAAGLAIAANLTAEAVGYVGGATVDVDVSLTDLRIAQAVLANPISRIDTIEKNIESFSFEGVNVESFTINSGTLDVDFTYSSGLALDYNFVLQVGGYELTNLGKTVVSDDQTTRVERVSFDLTGHTYAFGDTAQIPIAIQYNFQADTYVDNPTVSVCAQLNNFAPGVITFAPGSQVVKQETMSFDVPEQAAQVTFASGELAITVEGIEVDADIEISIAGNLLEKAPDSNTFLLAGYTIDFSTLENQQLPVTVDAVIPLDTIEIGDAREMVIKAKFSNLALDTASLLEPETFDVTISERVDLGDVDQLTKLKFGSGNLVIVIDDGGLGLEMPVDPVISINNQPLEITHDIDGTIHRFTVDLTGQEFDFTTLTELNFDVAISGSASTYVQGKQIIVEASLDHVMDNLEIGFDFEERIPVDLSALDEISGGADLLSTLKIDRNAFDVNLYFSNSSALSLSLQGLRIMGLKDNAVVVDETLALEIPALSDHFNLLESSSFLDTLFGVIEELPDEIVIQFGKFVTSNPNHIPLENVELTFEGGDYSVNLGFVLDGAVELKPLEKEDMAVDIPVEEIDIDSYIKEAILYIEVENHLPIDAEITLKLASDPANIYTDAAEITEKLILPVTEVDENGRVVQPATYLNLLQVDSTKIGLLQSKMYAGLIVKLNQGGETKTMTLSIDDYISLKMWAKVTVKVNQE